MDAGEYETRYNLMNLLAYLELRFFILLSLDFGVGVFMIAGTDFDPSTGQRMQKGFDLSTGQLSR